MAIMYPTKLLIHSFRTYLLSAYFLTRCSKLWENSSNEDENSYPYVAYNAEKKTDINKIKSKLQGMLNNRF